MRSYATNSPEAAVRIIALALLADGHVSETEYVAMKRHQVAQRLGLNEEQIHAVVQNLAEDLLAFGASNWGGSSLLDETSYRSLLREVSDTALRHAVMEICAAVTQADHHHSEAENALLEITRATWGMPAALH